MQLYKAIFISLLVHLGVLSISSFEINQTLSSQPKLLEIEVISQNLKPSSHTRATQSHQSKHKVKSTQQNLTQNLEKSETSGFIHPLHTPPPTYPVQSRKNLEQGVVKLKVLISESGLASEIQLLESSGYQQLDQAAKDALLKWTFSNPLQKPLWIEKKFRFKLASH